MRKYRACIRSAERVRHAHARRWDTYGIVTLERTLCNRRCSNARGQMLQRAKAKAQKAFEQREEAAKDSDSDVGHGGATPSPCAEARSEDAFSHGGISKKWRAKKERAKKKTRLK